MSKLLNEFSDLMEEFSASDNKTKISAVDYNKVANMVAAGNKIQAVSFLHNNYGLSLSEAKRICDDMQ